MARVDFYVLPAAGEAERRRFACRLTEKAYRLDHAVRILAPDPEAMRQMDDLLWTWREGSFVPHEVLNPDRPPESPVTICCDEADVDGIDLLINLCDTLPETADAFPRIAEIVTSDEDQRLKGRERFAAYRDQGHELETHKL